MVYILPCGEPQNFNEFPFTRKEISLQHTEGHSMVKKFFQVIILRGKLCFVYLIREKRRRRELAKPSLVQVIYFCLGNCIRICNYIFSSRYDIRNRNYTGETLLYLEFLSEVACIHI